MDIVVDGTDGAGKTPLVQSLVRALAADGRAVATLAPYRVEEVFPLWETDPRRAAATITGIMRRFRDAHPDALVVWDRGWPTAWVSTEDREALDAFLPLSSLTLLLLNTTEVTRMRAARHASTAPWMVEEPLIERFNRAYRALAGRAPGARIWAYEPDAQGRFDLAAITARVVREGAPW